LPKRLHRKDFYTISFLSGWNNFEIGSKCNWLQVPTKRVLYRSDMSLSSDDPLIARFCIPSKCNDDYESPDGIHCIRKCCPLGSVVNKTTKKCQKHPSSSSFSDDLNHQLREYRTVRSVRLDDFEIADGSVPPHCTSL